MKMKFLKLFLIYMFKDPNLAEKRDKFGRKKDEHGVQGAFSKSDVTCLVSDVMCQASCFAF